MNSIFYKVNGKGQYKNYKEGSYAEIHNASKELLSRAKAKGYKMVKRSSGNCGVILTLSNGETQVEIAYTTCNREKDMLNFIR